MTEKNWSYICGVCHESRARLIVADTRLRSQTFCGRRIPDPERHRSALTLNVLNEVGGWSLVVLTVNPVVQYNAERRGESERENQNPK